MSQVSSTKRLVSASAIMASGTLISRILGVVRVALLAFILGTATRQADIYGLADMVPNSLYILFAGGALNTVLVPQIVRAIKNDPDGGEAYTNRIMTAFMLIITGVTVAVTIGAPIVARIYTSEAWREPGLAAQYGSLVALMFLTLPQIFFYGAFFLIGQVLNARDKFGPMMWAPIANNVIAIIVLSTYLVVWGNQEDHGQAFTTPQILLLGLGSTLGIAVQTLVLLPFVKKVGFKLRPRFDLKGTGLGKTFSLTKWTIGFVAVNQLVLVIVQRLATSATATGQGAGVVAYANAHLLWILPHSLITVSLATAMLPSASRLAASGDSAGVAEEFMKTVRLALIVIVPATVVFLTLANPTTAILFGQGAGRATAELVAWALVAFAVGLIPFTVQFVCLRTFYALEDTRTPFLVQLLIGGLNAGGALLFVWLVKAWLDNPENWIATALAFAYSIAYLVGVLVSWRMLKSRVPGIDGGALALHIVRLLIGSAIGGVAAYFLAPWVGGLVPSALLGNILALAVGGLLILGSYVVIGKLLQVRELASLNTLLRSRLGRRSPKPEARLLQTESVIEDAYDPFDSGPPTIIRNRPPVVEHSFVGDLRATRALSPSTPEDPPALPVDDDVDAGFDAEDDAMDHPFDESSEFDDSSDDIPTPVRGLPYDYDDEPTGPLDVQNLFREEAGLHIATVGTLLHTRYELIELLAERHGAETWRAHDQVLSRDVVVHVLAPPDPRIPELLMAARKGAAATDSRFLRVLDADEMIDTDQGIGAYVVAEWAYGRSVKDLLAKGPLTTIEAAFVVREIADALVNVHAQGLFHEQINPDTVIITTSGSVRLVGFGVEATLAGHHAANAWSTRERADVVGLGKVLYAALVRHWPGGDFEDLPAAPIIAGETAPAHTVQAGVSAALDRICATTLTERGEFGAPRIETAAQLVQALNEVLGTADASLDLEHRVRAWRTDDHESLRPAPYREAMWAPVSVVEEDPLFLHDTEDSGGYSAEDPIFDFDHSDDPRGIAAGGATDAMFRRETASAETDFFDDDRTAIAPDAATFAATDAGARRGRERHSNNRRWWLLLALALILVAIATAFSLLTGDGTDTTEPGVGGQTTQAGQPTESTSAASEPNSPDPGPAGPINIVKVTDFDPETDGGNDEELPEQVANVTDGDPTTTWQTMRYLRHAKLGNLKPGVGLVLDLGEVKKVSSVTVTLVGGDTSVEVRVPKGDAASMRTEADWEVVGSDAAASGEATITLESPSETQFVLVYFTELPPVEGGFRAEVAEVTVS